MEDDANRPDVAGVESAAEVPLPEPPSPQDLEAAEGLIRQANLAKIRGDKTLYERLIQDAVKLAPGSSRVQEALGDSLVAARQVKHAKEAFQIAVKLDPTNASAERKYGEAVLSVQLALDPMFASVAPDDSFASGKATLIMSFIIPGLGQIAGDDVKKGVIMLAGWLIGVVWMFIIPQGLAGLSALLGARGAVFNGAVLLPLFFSAFFWIWSIGDAGARNKKFEKRVVIHPVPPVDKDFEL